MSDDSTAPTPPEGLPETVVTELDGLSTEDLRRTIVHAQELLQWRDDTPSHIDVHSGEDIIRVNERDTYTEVVKTTRCPDGCEDCPHGPYLYHVKEEPRPEGGTHTHWTFIGEVAADQD